MAISEMIRKKGIAYYRHGAKDKQEKFGTDPARIDS